MKKTIAILMILVLAGVGLFAANNNDAKLTLSTSVTGLLQIGLFTTAPASNSSFAATSNAAGLSVPAISADATANSASDKIFLSVRTNKKEVYYIDVTANALRTGVSESYDYLGYNLILNNATTVVADSETATTTDNSLTIEGGNGLRVQSFPLKVEITPTQAAVAVEGTYESTIIFTLSAS